MKRFPLCAICVLTVFIGSWTEGFGPRPVRFFYALSTSITVSASEEIIPNKLSVAKEAIRSNPSLTTDGALRNVPAFSLFRRSGSRTANPTTQGVALRGIGASGASRALVLIDGVPLNDPFGGWVYWNRVPPETIESIEIIRGGTSDIFGADALSGVIHFQRADVFQTATTIEGIAGNQKTSLVSISRDQTLTPGFFLRAAGQYFHSDGDYLVQQSDRGLVDTPAGSEHFSAEVHLQKNLTGGRLFLANSYYSESRNNGTQLQTNETDLWQTAAGGEMQNSRWGYLWFRFYGGAQSYDQSFSAVIPTRDSESLTRQQHVPSQHFGLSIHWNRQFGELHTLYSGLAFRDVEGESQEKISATQSFAFQGGRERTSGFFFQDRIFFGEHFTLTIGSRFDLWQKLEGHSRTVSGGVVHQVELFSKADEWQWSPRAVLQWNPSGPWEFVASAYRSFRPPTLNELYRPFRVGNVLTLANADLQPERLVGAETGLKYKFIHVNFFWNRIEDPISNFTLQIVPDLITRERRNIGRTETKGAELQMRINLFRDEIDLAYQFTSSQVTRAPEDFLEGNSLPQVPDHTAGLLYRKKLPADLQFHLRLRAASRAFDDDRNELRLPGYLLTDIHVSKEFRNSFDLLFGVENLFNRRVVISKTPIETFGTSTLITAGVRLRLE